MSKQTKQVDYAQKQRQVSFVRALKDRIKRLEQELAKTESHLKAAEAEFDNAEEARYS